MNNESLCQLPHVFLLETQPLIVHGTLGDSSSSDDGVSVQSYGQGQLSGVTYTVPAHAEVTVDFQIQMQCLTPDDVTTLTALIRSLLDASHQHKFDEVSQTSNAGGSCFFGLFGGSGSTSTDTKQTMDSYGLSEANQAKIVNEMMQLADKMTTFNYKGTIYNKDYDYDVTGNLFGIVMDCTIKQGTSTRQHRIISPNVHMQAKDSDGQTVTLPVGKPLYGAAQQMPVKFTTEQAKHITQLFYVAKPRAEQVKFTTEQAKHIMQQTAASLQKPELVTMVSEPSKVKCVACKAGLNVGGAALVTAGILAAGLTDGVALAAAAEALAAITDIESATIIKILKSVVAGGASGAASAFETAIDELCQAMGACS